MKNISGNIYGRWIVLSFSHLNKSNNSIWNCKCSCGTEKKIRSTILTNGSSKSCGCLRREISRHRMTIHGRCYDRIGLIYYSMKQRCLNVNVPAYKNYGARGITICEEWIKDKCSFFDWAYKNGYKESLTLDRIDNNGNYEPSNCRWATKREQANNRRSNLLITRFGVTKNVKQWCEVFNINENTVYSRIKSGCDEEFLFNKKSAK